MAQLSLTGYWLRSAAITEADKNTTKVVLDIPAKTLVNKVLVVVTEAFAGGSPSIDVGDGDDDDGWVDTTEITETSTGTYASAAAAYCLGKYYAAAGQLQAVIADGLTNGTAYVLAHCLDLSDVL